MKYQIESITTKNNRKLVIVISIILLLVLCISIGLGFLTAKIWKSGEVKANSEEEIAIADNENDKHQENNLQGEKQFSAEKFVQSVEDIYNPDEEKRVFLTFDDGPSANITPHILDTLKENDVKATFFVIGSRVSNNAELLQREYNEGHYIANHGYSHKYSKIYSSSTKALEEYNKTEDLIREALNKPEYESHLFRFPGGSVGGPYSSVKKVAAKEFKKSGVAYLDWNALTNDANGANTKSKIMSSLKKTINNRNNVVVLMHDAPDKKLTYESLNDVIQYLKEKGYSFKNMYDLM